MSLFDLLGIVKQRYDVKVGDASKDIIAYYCLGQIFRTMRLSIIVFLASNNHPRAITGQK
jgi:hypothetical protein